MQAGKKLKTYKYLRKQGNNNSRNTRDLFSKLEDNPNNSKNLKILQLQQMLSQKLLITILQ